MNQHNGLLAYIYKELASRTKEHLDINENTDLFEHLKLDSLHIMELILNVEDHYEISIPVRVLKNVKTVKDLFIQIEQITDGEL